MPGELALRRAVQRRHKTLIEANRWYRRLLSLARWAFPDVWIACSGSRATATAVLGRWPHLERLGRARVSSIADVVAANTRRVTDTVRRADQIRVLSSTDHDGGLAMSNPPSQTPTMACLRNHDTRHYTTRRDATYAPATVRKAYQLLAAALDAGVESGLIGRSPCRGVKLPRIETSAEIRFLDAAEISLLAGSIDSRYSAMVLAAAYTGLRFSELRALRVDRFDALRRTIRVVASVVESSGQFYFEEPKSEASRRTVRVPPFLVEVLAAHLATCADGSGLIFSAPNGGPFRRSNFRRRIWLPAVEASVGPPCTFHDLRHSHAALLIAQGEHPKVIQERLGHASIKTTLDTYGHLFEGLDEAAADRLEATFASADVHAVCTREDSEVIAMPAQ